ncbi:2-oxoglutarate and iron-dependent oxygenase domain-containing protein [Streptomyces sp. NPDC002490]|uniref:isopenicillin N synthase family dioxygenase n=1 Tax=Streptomyces sp. NPDC002490 TaxID=3154416 RepID=UPI0033240786
MSGTGVTTEVSDGFVPVIDLSTRRTEPGRRAIAAAIDRACVGSGFFVVVGHGVEQELVDRMFAVTHEFFELPAQEKDRSAHRPGVSGFRRQADSTARSLDQQAPPDLCETFAAHVTGELDEEQRSRLGGEWATWTLANVWPRRPEGFRETWHAYLAAMTELAADLMRLFARALDLPENHFEDKFDHHGSSIAANYYPPQHQPPLPGQLRRGPHTDFGSLTILHQQHDRTGLQVRQGTNTWRDIPAVPHSLVVNIGDLMALWTGGRWVSTMHRVTNPPTHDTTSRLTIPFFYLPNHDATIQPMYTSVAGDLLGAEGGGGVIAGEWMSRKLRKLFSGAS